MLDTYTEVKGEYINLNKAREYWDVATGLQAVDGLVPSKKLYELAEEHIQGKKNYREIKEEIKEYHLNNEIDKDTIEADEVSIRIQELLNNIDFRPTKNELIKIHKYLFTGIFPEPLAKYVGAFRDVNIRKNEDILNGASVIYTDYHNIDDYLDYDIEQERTRCMQKEFKNIPSLARFLSNIWGIHPFREGNTRSITVFFLKYLRNNDLMVDNELFKNNSKYFMDALVLSSDNELGITADYSYLERFLEKLIVDDSLKLLTMEIKTI